MVLWQTMLVYDSCDSCESEGIVVSVLTNVGEWTLCTPCLCTDPALMEVTHGF